VIDGERWQSMLEKTFFINFLIFSFIMFSCFFPTGFSATFSTLAFVFALPLALKSMARSATSTPILIGLLLFTWLGVSIFWSGVSVVEAVVYLLEYRIYFMLPVFVAALSIGPVDWQRWILFAVMAGCVVALIMSYGLAYGIVEIKGAHLSLANRIYHGFIMSVFYLLTLLLFRHSNCWERFLWGVVAIAIAYNVLFIEQGRTGYLQIIGITVLFIFLSFRRLHSFIMVAIFATGLLISFFSVEGFRSNVNETLHNV
jgi:hypothetical protein